MSSINIKLFNDLTDEEKIFEYQLTNKNGIQISFIEYGATITSLKIPLSSGKKVDVVLGFDNLEDYINSFDLPNAPYFGAIIGQYSGRIKNAYFALNGEKISLIANSGENHIHGGNQCFSKQKWELSEFNEIENAITFSLTTQENQENYPGSLKVNVKYQLNENNQLIVEYFATSTKDTIINLTQHSYFNLDGHETDVLSQELQINSDKFLETDEHNIPTGNFLDCKNSVFNYSSPKECPEKIDNTFVLNKENDFAASLFSKKNNLKLNVYTNQPAVHIYVGGNCFNQIKGKENTNYHPLSGICFETQNFPDAPNHNNFPSAVLKEGETYYQKTIFEFIKK